MAPKPKALADETRAFYWPDTGPVEYVVQGGAIVSARTVEGDDEWRAEA